MLKKWIGPVVLLLVTLLACGALADSYSFPYAGIRLDAETDWVVLTPETLSDNEAVLAQLGAQPNVLAADYAANHTVFEVYLPAGGQVSLSALQTEETEKWGAIANMTAEDRAAFEAAFGGAPYRQAGWSEAMPGYFAATWALEAGGVPVTFASLMTVRQGMLYTLTASGAQMDAEALQSANATVLAHIFFQGSTSAPASVDKATSVVVVPVEDDGRVTPMELVGYDGVTYEETTTIQVRTLPGAEVILRTATDALRGRADEEGMQRFQVSTKRESVYTYNVTAQAEGRTASSMDIAIDRQLTPEAQEDAYRKSARQISAYGYTNMVGAPEAYGGKPVTFRGRVGEITDMGGLPCALIFTENPGKGVWRSPIWVLLTDATQLNVDDIRTVYGDIRGDAMPYTDGNGETQQAPVVVGRTILN